MYHRIAGGESRMTHAPNQAFSGVQLHNQPSPIRYPCYDTPAPPRHPTGAIAPFRPVAGAVSCAEKSR